MDGRHGADRVQRKNQTTVERASDRELVVTRTFDAPARTVFEAWTTPELFTRWWAPKSMGMTILACEMDARTGGRYRLVFAHGEAGSMEFFGKYLEVIPYSRLVWTNEEAGDQGSVTTVTFDETDGTTRLVMRERYPSKEALDAAGTGAADATVETFGQLDELLGALNAGVGRS